MTMADKHVLAALRINPEQTSLAATACAVEPALTNCQSMGFAAFTLLTLDFIFICRLVGGDTIPTVIWRNCFFGCSKNHNLNSWEWYFDPVNQGMEAKARKVVCPIDGPDDTISAGVDHFRPVIDNSFRNRSELAQFRDTGLITIQERLRVNYLIQRYVRPNKKILSSVDDFYRKHLAGNTVLGVHVRGTDRWGELLEGKLPPLSKWVTQAAFIFDSLAKPKKIFIASDNDEAIVAFAQRFGREKVAFTNAKRAQRYDDDIPIHIDRIPHHDRDELQRELGTEVLIDILLLAKSDEFLHTESSVAALASYYNPHMKSYFLGDMIGGTCEGEEGTCDKSHFEDEAEEGEETERHECLRVNGPHSACPNVSKGKFVKFTLAKEFARG